MFEQLTKLTVSTLADDCYRVLRSAIINLSLLPSTPLDEGQIATQLGTSKTPVREALARLNGEGFVTVLPNRRTLVAPLSPKTTREVYSVRLLLEPASLLTVAPSITEGDLSDLERSIAEVASSLTHDDVQGFVTGSENFHSLLIAKTQNRLLMDMVQRLFDHADRVRAAIYRSEQLNARHALTLPGLENHRKIVTALRDGDSELAAKTMAIDIQLFLDATNSEAWQSAFARLEYEG